MSRNSQRRKDWDDEDYSAEIWREKFKSRRKKTTDWLTDEQIFQKRRNHRNKKDSSRF